MRYLIAALIYLVPSAALANVITAADVAQLNGFEKQLVQLQDDNNEIAKGISSGSTELECVLGLQRELDSATEALGAVKALSMLALTMRDKRDQDFANAVLEERLDHARKRLAIDRGGINLMSGHCSDSPMVVTKAQKATDLIDSLGKTYEGIASRL